MLRKCDPEKIKKNENKLTDIPVLIPVIGRSNEVLILDVYKMLGGTDSLYVCCMYAHIYKDVLPAHQVLFQRIAFI